MNKPAANSQQRINAVNRVKEEVAYSWINLGKRLCELKEVCVHGTFEKITEEKCELKPSICHKLKKI